MENEGLISWTKLYTINTHIKHVFFSPEDEHREDRSDPRLSPSWLLGYWCRTYDLCTPRTLWGGWIPLLYPSPLWRQSNTPSHPLPWCAWVEKCLGWAEYNSQSLTQIHGGNVFWYDINKYCMLQGVGHWGENVRVVTTYIFQQKHSKNSHYLMSVSSMFIKCCLFQLR